MANIRTLYSDQLHTDPVFPRTLAEAVKYGSSTVSDALNKTVLTDTKITVASANWVLDTVQSGYYSQTITLTGVQNDHPTVMIAPSGSNVLPTSEEQTAYDKVKYATVDSTTNKLKLYSKTAISTNFTITVRGVTI